MLRPPESLLCLLPPPRASVRPRQSGSSEGSVRLHPRTTGDIWKTGGLSGERAAERALTTGELFFSFFILFQMSNFSHYSDTRK